MGEPTRTPLEHLPVALPVAYLGKFLLRDGFLIETNERTGLARSIAIHSESSAEGGKRSVRNGPNVQ